MISVFSSSTIQKGSPTAFIICWCSSYFLIIMVPWQCRCVNKIHVFAEMQINKILDLLKNLQCLKLIRDGRDAANPGRVQNPWSWLQDHCECELREDESVFRMTIDPMNSASGSLNIWRASSLSSLRSTTGWFWSIHRVFPTQIFDLSESFFQGPCSEIDPN
jgi:hypothetical protein